ncbi:hypothetical protein SD71_15525 [Cohnella kolymensis]|uniref:Uncharacterized protein n=1 Tax=Cohnella kolymensis TaxID=1590652 RepID=A0ABR5A3E7_9BACL|nr:hypothetical protein SD71_15525 [Cohnella kolymensis]
MTLAWPGNNEKVYRLQFTLAEELEVFHIVYVLPFHDDPVGSGDKVCSLYSFVDIPSTQGTKQAVHTLLSISDSLRGRGAGAYRPARQVRTDLNYPNGRGFRV